MGLIIIVALAFVVVLLITSLDPVRGRWTARETNAGYEPGDLELTPLQVLETRYARGEIGRDEYLEKRRELGG